MSKCESKEKEQPYASEVTLRLRSPQEKQIFDEAQKQTEQAIIWIASEITKKTKTAETPLKMQINLLRR